MTTHEPVYWRNEQQGTTGTYCKWCHADWPCAAARRTYPTTTTNELTQEN